MSYEYCEVTHTSFNVLNFESKKDMKGTYIHSHIVDAVIFHSILCCDVYTVHISD